MDFLNKAYGQLSDLFRSMTPGARITAGLLLSVVVISLGYLFAYRTSGPEVDLMNGVPVPPNYVAPMEAAFARAGLESPEIRGTRIFVSKAKKAQYMAALVDANALPPNIESVFDAALEDTGPFTSGKQVAQRLKIAKEKMLAMTISLMNGIENAYVMYDTETVPGFRRERITTASVNVKPEGNEYLDESQVSAIRNLVAASVAGLKPQGVKVTDLNAGRTHVFDPEGGGPESNVYAGLKRHHEQRWKDKIRRLLSFVDNLTVETNVILGKERSTSTLSVKHDPKAVVVHEIDESSESTIEGGGPAGRVGYVPNAAANAGASLAVATSRGPQEEKSESAREMSYVTNAEQRQVESVGPTPKSVAVSIGIPSSYFEKVWKERNLPEEGQEPNTPGESDLQQIRDDETTEIKELVANMLATEGVTEGATLPSDLVKVKIFQDIKAAPIPAPALGDRATLWFAQYWGTLAMIVLALFSLLMLRSMLRSAPAAATDTGGPAVLSMAAGEPEDSPEEAVLNQLGRFGGSGRSLRDELSDLVQEDTEAAASILQTWIGNPT